MSNQTPAILAEIKLASASNDGQLVLLSFRLQSGADVALAIPLNNAVDLMVLNATAIGQAAKNQFNDSNGLYMFPVHWWKIGTHESNGSVVLNFRLPGGADIAFQVSPDAARHMHSVLGQMLGISKTTLPPGSQVN